MTDIPIFQGSQSIQDSWLTCGQFLSLIDEHASRTNSTEEEIKEFCRSKLSERALELFLTHLDKSWVEQKNLLLENFSVKLSIKEKVEIRKNLQQNGVESIDDFYERCVQAQYLVSDDIRDAAFEREVLLHFLIGLNPAIREIVLSAKCSSSQDYISEAKKYFFKIKEEPMDPDVKFESDTPFPYIEDQDDDDMNNLNHYDFCSVEFDFAADNLETSFDDEETLLQWKCELCPKSFPSKRRLTNHVKRMHSTKEENLRCEPCDKDFKSKAVYINHMKDFHPDDLDGDVKDFKCDHCDEIFKTRYLKKKHEEKEHNHLKRTCDLCKKECPDINFLAKHLVKEHCTLNAEGKTVCMYCNTFQRSHKRQVKYHILAVHFGQPEHKCTECDKTFIEQGLLKQHVKNVHSDDRVFQCDKCEKSFQTRGGLKNHIVVNHDEQKDCVCVECGKTFKNEVHLRSHFQQNHKSEKVKFTCDQCGQSFAQKESFKMHCLREHSNPQEREKHKTSCHFPDCTYSSFWKRSVEEHYERVHLKIKKFECHQCGKTFSYRRKMEEHINGVHLNLKPYKCDVCDFATAYKNIHYEHKKVAHGNQRFDCPHCNHSARYKGNLDKHIQNVHKKLKLNVF